VKLQLLTRTDPVVAPVRSHVVGNLREAILTGQFGPGERLVEPELCRLLGVSRPSLREALRQLEAERLVVITPFKGPAVAKIEWAEAQQIYDVRALLEGQAAYLFAGCASKPQIAEMENALRQFEDAVREDNAANRLFHTDEFYNVMLEGCGNAVIADLLTGLHARISFLRAKSMSRQGRSKESVRELRLILKTVAAGNGDGARAATMEHVRRASDAARASFVADAPGGAKRPRKAAKS
jgi:DNA-binding GntR family transcriptional regulator